MGFIDGVFQDSTLFCFFFGLIIESSILGTDAFNSAINIVADRINLLSHDSTTPFTLNDRKELITEKELLKILETAHPLIYGDELVNFLKQLIEVIRTHTHPFSMDPPCFTTPQTKVLDTDLDAMLSQSIKCN